MARLLSDWTGVAKHGTLISGHVSLVTQLACVEWRLLDVLTLLQYQVILPGSGLQVLEQLKGLGLCVVAMCCDQHDQLPPAQQGSKKAIRC